MTKTEASNVAATVARFAAVNASTNNEGQQAAAAVARFAAINSTLTKTEASKSAQEWDVCLTFQFPAWDETEGLWYRGILAKSKSEANAYARRQADRDGHLGSGKGRATFTAHATGSAQ